MKRFFLSFLIASSAATAQQGSRMFDHDGNISDVAREGGSVITRDDRGRPLHLDDLCFEGAPNRIVISIVRADKSINGDYAGSVVVTTTAGKCFYKASGMFVRQENYELVYHESHKKHSVKTYNVFRKTAK